jgi:hypothetical protein
MTFSNIYKYTLIAIFCLVSANLFGQKSALDRKQIISVQGEFLNPMSDFYSHISWATRMNAAYEINAGDYSSVGLRMFSGNWHTYDYDPFIGESSQTADVRFDDLKAPEQYGRTKSKGVEAFFKVYRKRKSALYPFGFYYEFGAGIHRTSFTGYHFYFREQTGDPDLLIKEPKRTVNTVSLSWKLGHQWVLGNGIVLHGGFGFRGHLALDLKDDSAEIHQESYDLKTLYVKDILGRDLLSSFVGVGYFF